jgi:hypothetical protein
VKQVFRGDLFWLLLLLLLSVLLQLLLLPTNFVGADTPKFLELSILAQEPAYWTDPSAFDSNYWSMGYPTFLALIWKLTGGVSIFMIQMVQVALAASLVPLTWSLAFAQGKRVRLLCALLAAVSPSVIFLGENGGYEILLGWLLICSLALLWRGGVRTEVKVRTWLKIAICALSGLAFGFSILVQNKAVIVAPVLLFLSWKWGRAPFFAFISVSIIPVLSWGYRNFLVVGSFSPLSGNGPINVWIGNNPGSIAGGFMEPPKISGDSYGFVPAAIDFWVSQPEATVTLVLRKLSRLAEPIYLYPRLELPTGIPVLLHYLTALLSLIMLGLLVSFAMLKLWKVRKPLPEVGTLAIFYGCFALVNLPFIAEPRFRAPLEPVLISISVPLAFAFVRTYRQEQKSGKAEDMGSTTRGT